nr:immunoglobulin light chain junction region [Macaca mulatta]MOV61821.1 immunoglobulin light chain junction region [Macaca mulatta]
CEQYNSYPLTF